MSRDTIIKEIRSTRDAYAKRFNYDLEAIYQDLKEKEKKSGRNVVSLPPKRVEKAESAMPREEAEEA